MRLNITGRNIEVTPALREYVEEKIGRITKHSDQIINLEVYLGVVKNPSVKINHYCEVDCSLSGAKIHVKEEAESMYASIDLLADKLDRQVKKHKEKNIKSKTGADSIRTDKTAAIEAEEAAEEGEDLVDIDFKSEEA